MKRILFLAVGYYLCFQAFIAGLNVFGDPKNGAILIIAAILSGWGGHKLIQLADRRRVIEDAPTKELDVPETQPLIKP